MTNHDNPVVKRYLDEFAQHLQAVEAVERAEMVREIENHIAEATHADVELSVVLEQLGPAARLADAYRAELALNKAAPRHSWNRHLRLLVLLATTSLPSFFIVSILALLGPGFMLLGLVAMVIGPLNLVLPGIVEISAPWPSPLAELSVFWLGIFLVMLGTIASGLLWLYVRFMRGVFQRALNHVRPASA